MNEETIKTILESITNYLKNFEIGEAKVFTSYLGEVGKLPSYDFTGVVHFSGYGYGIVYFSASSHLIKKIISALGQPMHESYYEKLIIEMAHIFSMKLRNLLGQSFQISDPAAFNGATADASDKITQIKIRPGIKEKIENIKAIGIAVRPCIIPIEFQGEKSMLVIYYHSH